MRLGTLLPVVGVVLALSCSLLQAQTGWKKEKEDPNRTVGGIVTNSSDEAVKGAVVQLKDTKTLQVRSFFTQSDGSYHFAGLNKNVDYELKATYQGFTSPTKRVSIYDSRKDVVLNLKLEK